MINYTDIKSVIPRLPKYIRNNYNQQELLSHALQAYRTLNLRQDVQEGVCLLEVENNKAQLPDFIKSIEMVTYSNTNVSICDGLVNEDETTCEDYSFSECVTNYNRIAYTLNPLFINTKYFTNNFIPLKYLQTDHNKLCNNCVKTNCTDCNNTFSIDDTKTLYTNIQECVLCIYYTTESDKIIDNNEVLEFLSYAVQHQIAIERAYIGEQNNNNMLAYLAQQYNLWYNKARGSVTLASINPTLISGLLFNDSKWLYFREFRKKYELDYGQSTL